MAFEPSRDVWIAVLVHYIRDRGAQKVEMVAFLFTKDIRKPNRVACHDKKGLERSFHGGKRI